MDYEEQKYNLNTTWAATLLFPFPMLSYMVYDTSTHRPPPQKWSPDSLVNTQLMNLAENEPTKDWSKRIKKQTSELV